MSLASQLNIGFTVAAMNPRRGRPASRPNAPAPAQVETARQVILEHQLGMYRVFRLFDGALLHSHEFRSECIRRAERDGYSFTLVQEV